MSADTPIIYTWDGDAMVPLRRFHNLVNKVFVVGQLYRLVVQEDRSQASHNHFFAAIHDAWLNLREDLAERFQNEEALRKYALIKAGYADERSIVCASKAEAQRMAAFVKPMDHYAVVLVSEATVKVYTARSQSVKAMGKRDFQQSKERVLEIIAAMIEVAPQTLLSNAGMAA